MNIEPTYVTFEQAKLLKEKRFNENCYAVIDIEKSKIINPFLSCNSELIKQAFSRPEQWQVCEWLRVVHGIWVEVGVGNLFHKDKFYILIKKYNIDRWDLTSLDNKTHSPYDIPQEAYSAAFDYVLNELI